ncbi:MAG: helix-turn-helix transcriptional regulator [Planctomycetes bacterium]|nr:helix-turn-helix transcriptional regulator [Planctomycetota bacterium]
MPKKGTRTAKVDTRWDARRLRRRFEASKLNTEDIASALEVRAYTVSRWIAGRAEVKITKIKPLARLLHCSTDDILPD